ncbi:putative acyltransferase [Pseudogulbenkiania sp. NH8B]|uniref:acyltransferase n=1 Tax=Pseudogulbenkiania sp. (strain NH8B) TaxID=748280 RepID=UPI0002279459|nr:acyltransferase [Pseudogulbenkiania sp. NH8B]BAK75318.1 putative acyltransferase [Pseudogulbenkiania sp. NH8B]
MEPLSREEVLALGFSHVGEGVRVSRRATFYDISGVIGDGARIDDFAILTGHIEIGRQVHVSPFCFLGGTGGTIRLGDGVGFSTHVSVFTKSDDYQQRTDGPRDKVCGDVVIGDFTIFGAQCVILPGSVVGKHCSVGIGCVVHDTLPDGGRYVSMGIKSVRLP